MVEAMDAIVKTLEEEVVEELYLESVHEATNARPVTTIITST